MSLSGEQCYKAEQTAKTYNDGYAAGYDSRDEEVKRLREALEEIAKVTMDDDWGESTRWCRRVAQRALAPAARCQTCGRENASTRIACIECDAPLATRDKHD